MDLPACTVSSIGGCHTDVQKELEVLRRTMNFWWFQHVSTQIQSSFGELWAFVISKFSGKKKAAIMFRSWGNMRESESMENLCRIPINIYQLTWIKFYGRSPCSMGKFTISMVIFNSNVTNYQRVISGWWFGTWILFSIYWECHHPTDELIFSRGVGIPPTRLTWIKFELMSWWNHIDGTCWGWIRQLNAQKVIKHGYRGAGTSRFFFLKKKHYLH